MELIGLKKCTTCKQVEKLLQDKNYNYTYREITVNVPTFEELQVWHKRSKVDVAKFWNTSSSHYREGNYKDLKSTMTADEQLAAISKDPYLCKRPILLTDDGAVYVGRDVKVFLSK